ncbi:MAG: hypothetical protein DMG06_23070 [Acidobacteria bacterium]|nr:MAG: hypothetical protein DMG06_23070 [Acidobacteriota bacterium]
MLSLWLGRAQAQMGQDARALTWLRPPFPVRVCFPQVHGSALLFSAPPQPPSHLPQQPAMPRVAIHQDPQVVG